MFLYKFVLLEYNQFMRVFIGIKLNKNCIESIKRELKSFKKIGSPIKWTRDENIHLTLKFIGEINKNKLEELIRKREENISDIIKFKMIIRGFGAFKKNGILTIFWAGVEKSKELYKLYNLIEDSCHNLGIKKDLRNFVPHITLGRNKKNYNFKKFFEKLSEMNDKYITEQVVSSFQIFKSELTQQGPIYSILKEIKIDAA